MVDLNELKEALVDVTEQDDMSSGHNVRIDDDYDDSDGSDDTQVTILSNVDIELVVGALDLANLSQLDGAVDSSSSEDEEGATSSDDEIILRLNSSRSGVNLDSYPCSQLLRSGFIG